MKIRKAVLRDARRVSLLIRRTLDKVNSKDYGEQQINVLKKINNLSETKEKVKYNDMFLAFVGKKLVGVISLYDKKIWGLYIHPDLLRKGIGGELLDYIEKYALKKRIKGVEIYSLITSHNFYKKKGYKDVEIFFPKIRGISCKMFRMTKRLK